MLQAEVLTAQSKIADAENLLKESAPDEQLEARRLIDLASLRRFDDALKLLAAAREHAKDPEIVVKLNLVEGAVYLNHGDPAMAEKFLHRALDGATRIGSHYWEALALSNLSYSSKLLHRYEDAVDFGSRAVAAADKVGARRVAAMAHGNLGSGYSYLGESDLAVEHEDKAVQIFKTVGAQSNLVIALGELGLTYERRGDRNKAITNYTAAYRLARELNRLGDAERNAENLSVVFVNARQWDQAAEWNKNASELLSSRDSEAIAYLARNRASIAYGRGERDEAAKICADLISAPNTPDSVLWEAHSLLGRIAADSRQFAAADREYKTALGIIENARSNLANSRYRITLLSRLIQFFQDYVDVLVEQGDDIAALRVTESSRARVLAETFRDRSSSSSFPSNAGQLQRLAAASHASYISFWIAPKRSFAWLITNRGIHRFAIPSSNEIAPKVRQYREILEHSLQDPIATHDASGAALWHDLLGEMAREIPPKSRVIVVPDGPLHNLNFEALPAVDHYWIEDVELAVAPSLTLAVAQSPTTKSQPRMLLIGDPRYDGTRYRPLPNAGKELHDIEQQFPKLERVSFQGSQATPAIYRASNPEHFSLIHFAAHAEADPDNPLESAIILSSAGEDNRLYARDVVNLPLHADLVTISGCRTAGARTYAGEGLVGFVWAFLRAGARTVAAALWDVSDSSTEPLMSRFYAHLARGADPIASLHAAKIELIKDRPEFKKPFYWAAFQTYVRSNPAK